MKETIYFITVLFILVMATSCLTKNKEYQNEGQKVPANSSGKVFVPKIIKIFPHNTDSYTQGLFYYDNHLYESTGQYGVSALMKNDIITGNSLMRVNLMPVYFGEGITLFKSKIYQLTWQNKKGFIYSLNTFDKIGEFAFPGEGWGITNDSTSLIISDGSNFLNFYHPESFELVKTLMIVRQDNTPVYNLNELEFIDSKIFANVYLTNEIVIINPNSGIVEASIDITSLAAQLDLPGEAEVANGIAYNPENKHYYFTGKYWSNLFEVELVEK